jgi:hypothetical protein
MSAFGYTSSVSSSSASRFGSVANFDTEFEEINTNITNLDTAVDTNSLILTTFFKDWRTNYNLALSGIPDVQGTYTEIPSIRLQTMVSGELIFQTSTDKSWIKKITDTKYFLIVRVYMPEFLENYNFLDTFFIDDTNDGSLFILSYNISPELIPLNVANNVNFLNYVTFLE